MKQIKKIYIYIKCNIIKIYILIKKIKIFFNLRYFVNNKNKIVLTKKNIYY